MALSHCLVSVSSLSTRGCSELFLMIFKGPRCGASGPRGLVLA